MALSMMALMLRSRVAAPFHVLSILIAGFFGLAATVKIADWEYFVRAVETYQAVPAVLRTIAVYAIPPAELVPIVLCLHRRTLQATAYCLVLIAFFTGVLAWNWSHNIQPNCACLGEWTRYHDANNAMAMGIKRNAALILIAIIAILGHAWTRSQGVSRTTSARVAEGENGGFRRGFTMVEVLISVSVVAVLVAIAMPVIGGAMARARGAASLSNLRTHASAIPLYANDHAGFTPLYLPPGEQLTLRINGIQIERLAYFDMHQVWHVGMAADYYGLPHTDPVFQSPSDPFSYEMRAVFTVYKLPCTYFARPDYWNPSTRLLGSSQFGPARFADITYPSAKSLIVETWPFEGRVSSAADSIATKLPAAMADGSASSLSVYERVNGYEGADGYPNREQGSVHFVDFPPLLHAIDGIRGRDKAR